MVIHSISRNDILSRMDFGGLTHASPFLLFLWDSKGLKYTLFTSMQSYTEMNCI